MSSFFWLVRKDILRFVTDRQGAIATIAVPVVLAAFLGMLFAPRANTASVDLLLVDEDHSPAARALIAAIQAESSFSVEELSLETARARLEGGDADVALRIPAGTGARLTPAAMFSGQPGTLELLHDPSDATEADIAQGLLTKIVMQHTMSALGDRRQMSGMFDDLLGGLPANADPALRGFLESGRGLAPTDATATPAGTGGVSAPVQFTRTAVSAAGPAVGYNSYAHNFSGTLLLFLLFGGQSAARNLVSERENGALLRARLSALSPAQVLLAAGLGASVVALLVSAAVYAVGMGVFGVRVLGSVPGFVGVVLAMCLFVGGFALLLAGLGRSEAQISSLGTFVTLIGSFAGGAMFPSFMMPGWLAAIGPLLPTWWATRGLAATTWRGLGFMDALPSIVALTVFAAAAAFVGVRRFRWA